MRWYCYVLVGAVLVGGALPAPAGIFSKRKPPDPAQRVPELVQIVKQDKDHHKRGSAAEELRQYDPAQFPQIVPVLVEVLQTDPTPSVRSEAAHTLSKLRPISQAAGQALEKATHDSALRVRLQARTSLMFYHMAGYSAKKTEQAVSAKPRTDEPPLATPGPTMPAQPRVTQATPPGLPQETAPPPLAATPAPSSPSLPRPMPSVPPQTAPPPLAPPAPLTVPENEGPVLLPPP